MVINKIIFMRLKEGSAPSPSTEQLSLTVKVLIHNTENEKSYQT